MPKVHKQEPNRKPQPKGKGANDKKENRHPTDQKQNKSRSRVRNKAIGHSGGTKGQNVIY